MNNNHTYYIEIYKAFLLAEESQLSKARALAYYLIEHIKIGNIPDGTSLPSVKDLRLLTGVSTANINEALRIMQSLGYLIIISGRVSTVKISSSEAKNTVNQLHADYHIKQSRLHVLQFERLYEKFKLDHSRATPPRIESSISSALIDTLATRVNFCSNLYKKPDQFFYTQDYEFLINAVALMIKEGPGVVVISSQNDSSLKNGLASTGLRVIEIDSDKDGFCVHELAKICSKETVAAIFISSKASFPRFTNTTPARIRDLFLLQKAYKFKIVENDLYSPWFGDRNNLLLELAGDALNDVIYIHPISYLLKDVSKIVVVAAQARIIAGITSHISVDRGNYNRSIAEATNELLLHKKFHEVQEKVRVEILSLRSLIWEVFGTSGYWKINEADDSGPGLFLTPRIGIFLGDAFDRLTKLGVHVYNPDDYQGSALDGLRFDLSYYISKKNFKIDLQKIEKLSRSICTLS